MKRLDAGEFHQILHPVYIRQALRVDRARFAKRAVELYEQNQVPGFMRDKLEELAFVGGSSRMWGDLQLIYPDVLLGCCDREYARLPFGWLEEATTEAPPFEEIAGAPL